MSLTEYLSEELKKYENMPAYFNKELHKDNLSNEEKETINKEIDFKFSLQFYKRIRNYFKKPKQQNL